jgi:RND family efflux transporter MFP subunit
VKIESRKTIALLLVSGLCALPALPVLAQDVAIQVQTKQVRENPMERTLPLSGRVFSRNDAALSFTLSGELAWVLEPGTEVATGEVIALLDQKPILLRKSELEHLTERERVNSNYLDKDLARLQRLRKDSNASERQVDEGESLRDISRLVQRSVQAKIDQVDDELRRSQLVAPFAGVIAQRKKRGGEYARLGDEIVRLVDLDNLELRFQIPVAYLGRIATGETVSFNAQSGPLSGAKAATTTAKVRTVIPAANPSSQTFEVRADIESISPSEVIAGQLVNVSVSMSATKSSIQIPRDAIVLRAEGNYVFRISHDNVAQKVMVEVGEGSREWVSVKGKLSEGDSVAVRGVERLQDGQQVSRIES